MTADLSQSFGERSARYTIFRPKYPQSVYDFLAKHLTGNCAVVVELGAGSGQATSHLAEMFDMVIAIEPDRRLADDGDFADNVTMQVAAAEDAEISSGSADAIIAATAFHWMNQPLICKRAAQWLRPGGVFFPFAFDVFQFEGEVQKFFTAEFEKWRPYRDPRLDDNYNYAEILNETRLFAEVISFQGDLVRNMSSRETAGVICTASYANAYACATVGSDDYFAYVEGSLAAIGDRHRMTFPIIGAVGRAP